MKPKTCRACGASLSRSFVNLGLSPLANSFVPLSQEDQPEKFYPLHVFVCDSCYLVQLDAQEAPEVIFRDDYAYYSSYSQSWLEHAKRYTQAMIDRFNLDSDCHVAEVASNDGYLLQWFLERGIPVTGIEPAANCAGVAREKGITTECLFFDTTTAGDIAQRRGQADLIAANNVLAHVPDLQNFVGGFARMLKPEGVATFEFPHLKNLIRFNQFDTIYHEHFSYLALGPVQRVLAKHGLRVFDVEELPTHGGSLRVFVCHEQAQHETQPSVARLLAEEKEAGLTDTALYDSFAPRVVAIKESLLEFLITARREGKLVCGYGAPAKGNTLLNYCGVGPEHLPFTVDRNPAKQNTFLPGVRIPVLAVEEIDRRKPDYVLVLPWNLKEEITSQMAHIREWGGRFVTAIPTLEVSP